MTNVIEAAHRSHARVVLTVQSFAWTSTGVKRQKALLGSASARANLARQIAAAVRDRGADGVNLDFEPIAPGYADEFTALVRKVRSTLRPGRQGLPADLRHDRAGSATTRSRRDHAQGRRRRHLHHGLRLPVRAGRTRRVDRADRRSGVRHPRHDQGLSRPGPGHRSSSSACPYYGRAWSTSSSKLARQEPLRGEVRAVVVRRLRDRPRHRRRARHASYDATEGRGLDRLQARDLHEGPWLRHDVAAALLRRRQARSRRSTTSSTATACAASGSGPSAMTGRGRSSTRRSRTSSSPTRSRRPSRAASLSTAVISPNGDGRLDTTTARLKATGLDHVGLRRPAPMSGTKVGKVRPLRQEDRQVADVHLERHATATAIASRTGPTGSPLWAADISGNRAAEAVHGLRRHQAAGGHDRRRRRVLLPRCATSTADSLTLTLARARARDRRRSGSANTAGKTVRSWSFRLKAELVARPGPARTPTARSSLTVATSSASTAVTAPAIGRSVDRPVLVDRTIASVRWTHPSFDPRAKASSRPSSRCDARRASPSPSTEATRGSARSGPTRRPRPATIGWTWSSDGRRQGVGPYVKPGTYRVVVIATSKYGTTRYLRA